MDREQLGTPNERAFALAQEGTTLLHKYLESYNSKALELAEQRLQTAIDLDPAYAFAWFNRGIALEYLGNHQEAIHQFRHLQEYFPTYESEEVAYNLATAYLCQYEPDSYRQAETLFAELARTSSRPEILGLAHASLATVFAQTLVVVLTGEAPEEEADSVELRVRQHVREATLQIERLNTSDPRAREAQWLVHNALGLVNMYRGQQVVKRGGLTSHSGRLFSEAEREFELALTNSPRNLDVLSNLGTLWLFRWKAQQEDHPELLERSRQFWTQVIQARPRMSFAYYRLGQVERRLGNFAKSVEALNRALEAFPEVPEEKVRAELQLATGQIRADPDTGFHAEP
jgi:tetratricopeptide (TPR) repeat protein